MNKNIKDLWKQWVRATGFIHDDMDMCYKIFEAGAMCFAPEEVAKSQLPESQPEHIVQRIEQEIDSIRKDPTLYKEMQILNIKRLEPYIVHFEAQMIANLQTHPTFFLARQHFSRWLYKITKDGTNLKSLSTKEKREEYVDDLLNRIVRLRGNKQGDA